MSENLPRQIMMMKNQLSQIEKNPAMFERMLSCGGYVCAGFGGDLNGVHIPETLLQGRLPPGTSPAQALEQVKSIMREAIAQAEKANLAKIEQK